MVETAGALVQVMWSPLAPRVNEEVTFTDAIGNISKLDFGDGHYWVSSGANDKFPVKHTYSKSGTYNVTAIGRDQTGALGTDTEKITVSDGSIPPPPPPPPPPVEPGYIARLWAALIAFLKSIFGK